MVAESDRPNGLGEVELAVNEFCRCFNRADYFEAHEVLEAIWLPVRRTPEGDLWQGLIQLAAAFVHTQRGRRGPALSLLHSAKRRIREAVVDCPWLDLPSTMVLAEQWTAILEETNGPELPARLMNAPPLLRFRPSNNGSQK